VRVRVRECLFLDVCTSVRAYTLSDCVYVWVFIFMQKGHTSQSNAYSKTNQMKTYRKRQVH